MKKTNANRLFSDEITIVLKEYRELKTWWETYKLTIPKKKKPLDKEKKNVINK